MTRIKKNQKKDLKTWVENVICETFGVESPEMLIGKNRKREILIPRQLAILILLLSGKTTAYSGGSYGKDHATALNSRKRIFEILETKDVQHGYNRIVKIIKQAARIYPEIDLSTLPRGWDDPKFSIHQSYQGQREQHYGVPSMQG